MNRTRKVKLDEVELAELTARVLMYFARNGKRGMNSWHMSQDPIFEGYETDDIMNIRYAARNTALIQVIANHGSSNQTYVTTSMGQQYLDDYKNKSWSKPVTDPLAN